MALRVKRGLKCESVEAALDTAQAHCRILPAMSCPMGLPWPWWDRSQGFDASMGAPHLPTVGARKGSVAPGRTPARAKGPLLVKV